MLIRNSHTFNKENILNATREKWWTYKRTSMWLIPDLLSETMEAQRQWNDVQSAKNKIIKLSTKNSISSKSILKKKNRQNKDIPRVNSLLANLPYKKIVNDIIQDGRKWHQKIIWTHRKKRKVLEMVNMWVNIKDSKNIFFLMSFLKVFKKH